MRRRAIVAAARSLMQETGQAGFSMRALADKAGVSIATPYNLFGSKQAVMYAVIDADLEEYQSRLEMLETDELDTFFEALRLVTELYAPEPGFYRAVLFAAYGDGGTEFRAMFGGPRHAMWRRLVKEAQAAGHLIPELEPNSFTIHLGHVLFACTMEWVNGLLSLEEMQAHGQYGFAVALSGVATPAAARRLRQRALEYQTRLNELYRERQKAASKAGTPRVDAMAEPHAAAGG